MKNFCPNCGTSLKADAEFCPNCGIKIKKQVKVAPNVSAPTPMPPKKPKKNNNVKIIIGALLAIVVICVAVFVVIYHNESSNTQNETKSAMTHKGKKKVKSTDQTAQTSSSQKNSDNYSNDEWMLMGYMAYAYDNYVESDDISNDSELVDAVEDDLSNGDLEVSKNSDTNYTLTNKYGSVDVDVASDDVEVSNDGDTTNAKSELEKKFSSYRDQLQKMSSYIKNDSSSSDDDTSKSSNSNSDESKTKDFTDEQYVVAAFLSAKADESSPKVEITRVEKLLAKGYNASRDDYLSGLKNSDEDYYYVAFNASTSQYERYTIKDAYVLAQPYSGGVAGKKYKYSFNQLVSDFGPYKDDLNKIIAGIKYNGSHLSEYNDKLRERGE